MAEDVKWPAVGGGGGGGGGSGVVLIWPIDWAVAWGGESRQKDETQSVSEAQSDGGNHPKCREGNCQMSERGHTEQRTERSF